MNKQMILGCVGDDFTGSSDAASFLVNAGMKTVLLNGIPKELPNIDCDAIIIALKTRSIEKTLAVKESLEALAWLSEHGAKHLYIKYCSTFDSTPAGNIGPIIDAALEKYDEQYTMLCPALPVNKRIVRHGELWVDDVLLAESAMKNHPLNPMWASDIAELIKPQGKYPCLKIPYEMLDSRSLSEIKKHIADYASINDRFYIIPDYISEEHAKKIAEIFGQCKILTGGSGVLTELAKYYNKTKIPCKQYIKSSVGGRGILLAGSCSKATLAQIACFQSSGGVSYKIDPLALLNKTMTVEMIWQFVEDHQSDTVLLYSSAPSDVVQLNQQYGRDKIANIIEQVMAELGKKAYKAGIKKIIVAGGETSGAVTQALGFNAFIIGESIAPGVPIMAPVQDESVRLVLKSGNFGDNDFFNTAINKTKR